MSKAAAQTIANEPKMHRAGVCHVLLPSHEVSNTRAGNSRYRWGLHVCSAPTVPAACPDGSRYSLLFQGLIQRRDEELQSSRLRDVFRGYTALTLCFKPRSTRFEKSAMPPHSKKH